MPIANSDSVEDTAIDLVDVGPDTATDGLWHQAQTVFGAISRSRCRSGQLVRTVGVTSCYRHEGVSTVAAVIALAAACQRRVLLVDANLKHPSVHQRFRVEPAPGVLQIVTRQTLATTAIQTSPLGVDVITAGSEDGPTTTFLRADLASPMLKSIESDSDLVILDLPAVSDDSSALELSSIVDAVVFVIESERVHRQAALRAMSRLQKSGVNLIGAVFNKRRDYTPNWLYRML